jgi:dipeptidyl aminopeptidase/acylaminoacyl peptidase
VNRPRFEQFFAIRRFAALGNVAFSPVGDQVSYTHDGSGQMNLWSSSVEGGWPVQLTTLEEESVRHHVWTPHGFVLAVDQHGSEQWQINRLSTAGGWPRDLTGRTDVQYQISARALDDQGERLIFGGNQARPADQSLYLLHIADDEIRPVLEDEGNWVAGPWHPDGRHVAVGEFIGNTDQHLHLLDLHSGERRDLTPHEGDEVNAPVGFSRDGRSLLMVTDRGHENVWLGRLPLENGATAEAVWRGGWDVEHALLSRDRRTLAWTVNEGGYSRFFARDLQTGLDLEVPELPRGHCLHFAISGDGRRLAAVIGTGVRPYDVYVADLKSATVTRVTESALGGIPEADLVDPELVSYPTFDGGQVPAWLYRPQIISGRIPVLLSIHGGPEAQERGTGASTLPFYQYLLSRGVGVLAPNIRGSSGYGKSYQKQIHRDWGGAELRDIEHAAIYLRTLPWVDRDRLAVYGGSFGGFATLSAMTRLARLLGLRSGPGRPGQPGHLCARRAAILAPEHEGLGRGPRRRRGDADEALTDHLCGGTASPAAGHTGRSGPARRQVRVGSDGRAPAGPGAHGRVPRLRGRGTRPDQAAQPARRLPHDRRVPPPPPGDRRGA